MGYGPMEGDDLGTIHTMTLIDTQFERIVEMVTCMQPNHRPRR